jgi:3-phenylpropionate/trans-cinnamate dioxygenase ferredoxin reductase subunit
LAGIFGLRSLDDSKAIKAALETAHNVVIIGGGFIGLEVAAVARKNDRQVTVLEAAERLMARVVPPAISSQFYLDLHTAATASTWCSTPWSRNSSARMVASRP